MKNKNLKRVSHSDFQKLLIGFKNYDMFFCNHFFKYTYITNYQKVKTFIVRFKPENFLHLCGCTIIINNEKINGKRFYQALKDSKINNSNVFYKDRFTKPKLQILPQLDILLSSKNVRVIEQGSFLNLKFDKIVRTRKMIGAIACINIKQSNFNVPESLINLKIRNIELPSYPVISIERDSQN